MTKLFVESVGFSGTTSIADMLRADDESYVTHGTKNFEIPQAYSDDDPTLGEFVSQMERKESECSNCIAIHTSFDPKEISEFFQNKNIKFYGLARKSQKAQILSCFFWKVNQFLSGQELALEQLSNIHKNHGAILNQIGLASNMVNCFLLFSVHYVLQYNFKLSECSDRIFFLEDISTFPDSFVAALELKNVKSSGYTLGKSNSHRSKTENFSFLSDASKILEKMVDFVQINTDVGNLYLSDIEYALTQKSSILK